MFFRQTWLKRLFVDILGLNYQDIKEIPVSSTIIPTVEIKPYLNVVASVKDEATTNIYTTPADKDFYLVSASLAGYGDLSPQTASIDVIPFDQPEMTQQPVLFIYNNNGTVLSNSIFFGERGIKVKRNTSITLVCVDGAASASIAGYTAGDR